MSERDRGEIGLEKLNVVQQEISRLRDENLRLKNVELELTDSVIGLRAQLAELEHRFGVQTTQHAKQIESLQRSWSWRVGQTIVKPFSKLKKIVKK